MQKKSKDEVKNSSNIGAIVNANGSTSSKNGSIKTTSKKRVISSVKKTTVLNTSSKKAHTKVFTKIHKKEVNSEVEYYDLPYRYNETTVKILAQTPTTLFIYWDISDMDRASYIQKYGEDFFSATKPILIVKNNTLNYSFEVEINDFANSWYLHVNDANCDYSVELGRRPINLDQKSEKIDNYIYVSGSNKINLPNNHILFDKFGNTIFFKNVKNNFTKEVPVTAISYIQRFGKVYNINTLYKEIYRNEINIEEQNSNTVSLDFSSSNSSTFM